MLAIVFTKPAIDWPWGIRAYLAHFGLGFQIAWFISLLMIWFFCRSKKDKFYGSLVAGFWGAVASVAIDLDHAVYCVGKTNGRWAHKEVAYASAVLIPIVIAILILKKIFKKNGRDFLWLDSYWYIVIFCVLVCWVVHVVEDYTLSWF